MTILSQPPGISAEQIAALFCAKERLGRNWKQHVADAWFHGNYVSHDLEDLAGLLQEVRNELGPSWLYSRHCNLIMQNSEQKKSSSCRCPRCQQTVSERALKCPCCGSCLRCTD